LFNRTEKRKIFPDDPEVYSAISGVMLTRKGIVEFAPEERRRVMADNTEMEQLKSDLASLRKDVAALTEAYKDRGVERARATAEGVRDQASQAAQTVSHQIEDRPYTSVLSAFGIGLIIGRLLDRS